MQKGDVVLVELTGREAESRKVFETTSEEVAKKEGAFAQDWRTWKESIAGSAALTAAPQTSIPSAALPCRRACRHARLAFPSHSSRSRP